LRIDFKIRKKRKHTKTEEFVKEIKKMHEEMKAALTKLQNEIKNMQIEIERRQLNIKWEIMYC